MIGFPTRCPPRRGGTRYKVRFEKPPGEQMQVNVALFNIVFTDEPTTPRMAWLLLPSFRRLKWARFVGHRYLPGVLRCHASAVEALAAFSARCFMIA